MKYKQFREYSIDITYYNIMQIVTAEHLVHNHNDVIIIVIILQTLQTVNIPHHSMSVAVSIVINNHRSIGGGGWMDGCTCIM